MWESRRLKNLWASTACYKDGFIIIIIIIFNVNNNIIIIVNVARRSVVGLGTMLPAGMSLVRIPMRLLNFLIYLFLQAALWL
jgi:hypothetical protein